ncbi:MAG: hypothetical protein LBC72_00410 [Spirochaetaceae bacterium]|jgi:hypothetical protein|nr:hypothetical protein [Spirochaetaceae bacterium]
MNSRACLLVPLVLLVAACKTTPYRFVPASNFSISSGVNVSNIDDYERIVRQSGVKTVFYTDQYFIAQIDGVLYTIESKSYTSFREYREGKLKDPVPWAVFKPVQGQGQDKRR